LTLVLTVGCKSGGDQPQPAGMGMSQSTAPYPFNDPKYQDLVSQVQGENAKSSGMFETESNTSKITSKLKEATAAVGGALTFKPKVNAAGDPVSLASRPDQITPELYYQAARLAEHNGNSENAVKQYQQALQVDDEHVPSLIGLARLYDRKGEFNSAVKWYRKTIEVAPDNSMAHNDLALCLSRNKNNQEAVAELRKAIALEPSRKLYRNNLATILVGDGQPQVALAELNAVHPPATANYNVAFLLANAGRDAEARQYVYRATQIDPSMQVAVDLLQSIDARMIARTETAQRVQRRVDDQPMAGTSRPVNAQPVSNPHASVDQVQSPDHLRRVPPTGMSTQPPTSPPPVMGMPPAESPNPPRTSQFPAANGGYQMQYPVRRMSGYTVDDSAESLPTPELLDPLKPSDEEPVLEPAMDSKPRVHHRVNG
jgi:tetratricopeptide (TPR) repeat protein